MKNNLNYQNNDKKINQNKQNFQKYLEKEKNINEEKEFFEKIEIYEENLKNFFKDLENKKLQIIEKNWFPKIIIKWDYNENFEISEKYKEETEKLKNIFEEYKIIAEKLEIKYFKNLSFLKNNNILNIVKNKNKNFLKKFINEKDLDELKFFFKLNNSYYFENYDFLKNEFWFDFDLENFYLDSYIKNYDFFKNKIDIDKKILELLKKENNINYYLSDIFKKENNDLKEKIKKFLIGKNDFENIYENLWEFLPLNESLFLELKNYLLEKDEIKIYSSSLPSFFISENFYEEKSDFIKKIIISLEKEDFMKILEKFWNFKKEALEIYLKNKNKEEIKNILQNIYENNILESYDLKYLLKNFNIKIDYKNEIKWFDDIYYKNFFNNFPLEITKISLLKHNAYFENWIQKERFFSEEENKILDNIIKTFSDFFPISRYFLRDLNYKNYENIENVLKNEKIITLLKKIFIESSIENGLFWFSKFAWILWREKITEEKLEKILEKIILIKNNKLYQKIEKKEYIISNIFDKEIENIDEYFSLILEDKLSERAKYTELKWNDYINFLKDEKQKEEIIKEIKNKKDFFYEKFNFSLERKTENLDLEETKKFLENFDKKIKEIIQIYDEYTILKVWNNHKIEDIGTFEKRLKIYKILENSKSYEVKKLAENIFEQISELENPEGFIEKIEKIFLENKLPYTAKIFKIFSLIYDEDKINDKISEISSPYLQKLKEKWKSKMIYSTFFKDLLKTHIFSANRDFKNFLVEIEKAKNIFLKEEKTEEEKIFLHEIVLVLWSLTENTDLKNNLKVNDFWDLEKNISEILEKLNLKNISEVFDLFENNFLKEIGFPDTKSVLDFMKKNVSEKNEKAKNFWNFEIEKDDLVKWFDSKFYNLIWNQGFVSREFLWVEWDSDRTPFDLDLIKIENENFEEIINNSTASSFGDTFAVIKSGKNEIYESDLQKTKSYKNHGFELFKTWVLWENHFWVRTWLPSSSIDFFVHKSKNTEETYNFFYSIAKSEIFIPVLDENKNIIFSYDDFLNFRKIFAWVKNLSSENIFVDTKLETNLWEIIKIYEPKKEEFEEIENLTKNFYSEIENILKDLWIEKRQNKAKIGYEIQSTGSTWRNTFLPNSNFDFDLNIKLDDKNYEKVWKNIEKFLEIFENKNLEKYENKDWNWESLSIQFLKWEKNIENKKLEIDLLFSRITDDNKEDTNKILEEKLENIRKNNSEEKYNFVIANIRMAKSFLKEKWVYKKQDWGLWWVWIEFWILNNDWNFEKAVKSFLENALDENSEFINYSDFKKKYFIYSAWENIKWKENEKIENFIFKIWENGYFKICNALENMIK